MIDLTKFLRRGKPDGSMLPDMLRLIMTLRYASGSYGELTPVLAELVSHGLICRYEEGPPTTLFLNGKDRLGRFTVTPEGVACRYAIYKTMGISQLSPAAQMDEILRRFHNPSC